MPLIAPYVATLKKENAMSVPCSLEDRCQLPAPGVRLKTSGVLQSLGHHFAISGRNMLNIQMKCFNIRKPRFYSNHCHWLTVVVSLFPDLTSSSISWRKLYFWQINPKKRGIWVFASPSISHNGAVLQSQEKSILFCKAKLTMTFSRGLNKMHQHLWA